MANWKVYSSLDEALDDISFETGLSSLYFGNVKDGEIEEKGKTAFEELDKGILRWLKSNLEQYELDVSNHSPIMGIFLELFSNAYRAGINNGGTCSISVFLGKQGILIGTRQECQFLTEEQIGLLKERKNIPSTRISNGCGTRTMTCEGNGIFIDASEKAVYVLKYFR